MRCKDTTFFVKIQAKDQKHLFYSKTTGCAHTQSMHSRFYVLLPASVLFHIISKQGDEYTYYHNIYYVE